MKRNATIPLGHIFGIPIDLDYSWFLIFVLLTWTLAVGYYPAEFPGWPVVQYWMLGAVTAIMLFASVLLHELGHSVVAMRYQIPVRRITLFIFGGIAQIGAEPPSPSAEFWIAIAGPAVSLTLAILFGLLQPVAAALPAVLALGHISGLHQRRARVVQLDSGFSARRRPRLPGDRLGHYAELSAGDGHSRQRGTVHWLPVHFPRGLANLWRQFHQWPVDRLHRLVFGERRQRPDHATPISGHGWLVGQP